MSQEEQSYANVFLTEFMNGGIQLEGGKTFHDYIVEYQTRARDNRTQRFADTLGLDAELLRDAMRNVFSESDITNALLKPIKDSIDLQKAETYFEQKEEAPLPMRKVMVKIDELLRKFILQGGFEIEPNVQEVPVRRLNDVRDDEKMKALIDNMMKSQEGTSILKIVSECQKEFGSQYPTMDKEKKEWFHVIDRYVKETIQKCDLQPEETFNWMAAEPAGGEEE